MPLAGFTSFQGSKTTRKIMRVNNFAIFCELDRALTPVAPRPASGAYGKPGRIRSNIRGRCDNGELRQQRPVGRHLSQPQSRRCPYRLARAALKRAVHEAFGRGAGNRAGGGRRSPLDIGLGTRLSAGLPTRLEDHRRPARQRHRLGNDRHGQRSGYLRHQGANGRQPGDSPGRPHSREPGNPGQSAANQRTAARLARSDAGRRRDSLERSGNNLLSHAFRLHGRRRFPFRTGGVDSSLLLRHGGRRTGHEHREAKPRKLRGR